MDMDTMKIKILDSNITGPAGNYEKDQEVELSIKSAKALIAEGKAKEIVEKALKASGKQEDHLKGEDDIAKLTSSIDAKYKRDDLAEKAKAAGIEFAYDAKKADIVAAVIASGKVSAFLAVE